MVEIYIKTNSWEWLTSNNYKGTATSILHWRSLETLSTVHYIITLLFPQLESWNIKTLLTILLEICLRLFPWLNELYLFIDLKHWGKRRNHSNQRHGNSLQRTLRRWLLPQADLISSSLIWFLTSFYATFFSEHTLNSSTTGPLLKLWVNKAMKFL